MSHLSLSLTSLEKPMLYLIEAIANTDDLQRNKEINSVLMELLVVENKLKKIVEEEKGEITVLGEDHE